LIELDAGASEARRFLSEHEGVRDGADAQGEGFWI
jgi:hypothetical protein